MTHSELVDRAVRWLRGTRRCRLVYAEIVTSMPLVPDAIGWGTFDRSELVEVKVSRSDYHRDRRKMAHQCGILPGRMRWYLTPPGLLRPDELPLGWGLVEAGARMRVVRTAVAFAATVDMLRTETGILASAARRHELGVPFDAERGRFAAVTP